MKFYFGSQFTVPHLRQRDFCWLSHFLLIILRDLCAVTIFAIGVLETKVV